MVTSSAGFPINMTAARIRHHAPRCGRPATERINSLHGTIIENEGRGLQVAALMPGRLSLGPMSTKAQRYPAQNTRSLSKTWTPKSPGLPSCLSSLDNRIPSVLTFHSLTISSHGFTKHHADTRHGEPFRLSRGSIHTSPRDNWNIRRPELLNVGISQDGVPKALRQDPTGA